MKISAISNNYIILFTLIFTQSCNCQNSTKSPVKAPQLNFILIFARPDLLDSKNESLLVEGLNFKTEKCITPCLPKNEENPTPFSKVLRQNIKKPCDCEVLLKNSLLSLLTWSQNILGMSTATVRLEKCGLNSTSSKRRSMKHKKRLQRSPVFRLNIIKPSKDSLSSGDSENHVPGKNKDPFFNTLPANNRYRAANLAPVEIHKRIAKNLKLYKNPQVNFKGINSYYDENVDGYQKNPRISTTRSSSHDFMLSERSEDAEKRFAPKTISTEDEDEVMKSTLKHSSVNLDYCPKHKIAEEENTRKPSVQAQEISEQQNILKINQEGGDDEIKPENKKPGLKKLNAKKRLKGKKLNEEGEDVDEVNEEQETEKKLMKVHGGEDLFEVTSEDGKVAINNADGDVQESTTIKDEDYVEQCKVMKINAESNGKPGNLKKGQAVANMSVITEETGTDEEVLITEKNDGKVEDVFEVFNIMSTMKDSFLEAFLDPLWGGSGERHSPSLYDIVKKMMEDLQMMTNTKGYIAIINGGKLSELRSPESQLMKTVKFLNSSSSMENTVLILTGDCPKGNTSFVPLYINGPCSEMFDDIEDLPQIPLEVKKVLERKFALKDV